MSQTAQLPAETTVSSLGVTHVMQSQPSNGVSCLQWVSGWLPSRDCSTFQWGHFPVPREFLGGPDFAKSPPVACSKHARSGWDQVSVLASPHGWWPLAGNNPQPPWHDEVERCRPRGWTEIRLHQRRVWRRRPGYHPSSARWSSCLSSRCVGLFFHLGWYQPTPWRSLYQSGHVRRCWHLEIVHHHVFSIHQHVDL